MNVDQLAGEISADAPSGENLEYDQVFIDLELAAAPREEQQIGDEIRPAEDPDFREVEEKALGVLAQSHDLRAAIHLAVARLARGGIEGFADALQLIRRYLEDHWETCHPALDAEDDNDPTMRVNALSAIADRATVLRRISRAPLTESRAFGRISLADVDGASGETLARFHAAMKDTGEDVLTARRAAVDACQEAVRAIDAKCDAEIPGRGPDLSGLLARLRAISELLGQGGSEAAPEKPEAAVALGGDVQKEDRIVQSGDGTIRSTADVTRAIEQIVAFYQQTEPSSPVPILLERAKRLVNADFMTIIRDIAPEGMDNVRSLSGLPDDDDEDEND